MPSNGSTCNRYTAEEEEKTARRGNNPTLGSADAESDFNIAVKGDLIGLSEEMLMRALPDEDTFESHLVELEVGLDELNAVDPELESAWFQPLNLKCDFLVSYFAFKSNLYRYVEEPHMTDRERLQMLREILREFRYTNRQCKAALASFQKPGESRAQCAVLMLPHIPQTFWSVIDALLSREELKELQSRIARLKDC